jgi:anaerobic selenocysteine-containing dehydrogenase
MSVSRPAALPTFCRICAGICGVLVTISDGRVTRVVGDRDNALTGGFTCVKGRRLGEFHHAPDRYLSSQRRVGGGHIPIEAADATREVGARLRQIVERHGPDSVAVFIGTQSYTATLTYPFVRAWARAVGTRKVFSTATVDQSAKRVAAERLGSWLGGGQRFGDSDVWLLAGTNPLVSMQFGELGSFPVHGGPRRLREARRRGLKLIVVDPRRSDTAQHADHHLALIPGTDAVLFAGLLHVVLTEGLHDRQFCERYAAGLAALTDAVRDATPAAVALVTGLAPAEIVTAARTFATARRGMAASGTGANMGPWSNLVEHLLQALNVVCGRFPRAGDPSTGFAVLRAAGSPCAQVSPPGRSFEHGFRSRIGGYGTMSGELPAAILPDEILEPGRDRVRALVVSGGNPASCLPDQAKAVRALSALDLLVTVDPFPTETARLAHYVIAPAMSLERADHTGLCEPWFSEPFAQYTEPLLPRPPGVVEDWEFFLGLAGAMGLTLRIGQHDFAPGDSPPSAEQLLAIFADGGPVGLDEVRAHPHGARFDLPAVLVRPGDARAGRFELCPPDVAAELAAALAGERLRARVDRPFRLVVRRERATMNSLGRRLPELPETPYNPCRVHPDDAARLSAKAGDTVEVASDHGRIRAVLAVDPTLRPGVVSMAHCYGDLPGQDDDPRAFGANPGRLLSLDEDIETINAMPRITAVPVSITVC